MKLCIDCKHFGEGALFRQCLRTKIVSMVDGSVSHEKCSIERATDMENLQGEAVCGPSALYFDPIEVDHKPDAFIDCESL